MSGDQEHRNDPTKFMMLLATCLLFVFLALNDILAERPYWALAETAIGFTLAIWAHVVLRRIRARIGD